MSATDSNGVRTMMGTEPADRITDPALYHSGVRARRILYGTGGEPTERLWSGYKIRPRDFFFVGRVFLVLWVEPAGETTTAITSLERSDPIPADPGVTHGRFGEHVYSKVRRFVVIRAGSNYCSAIPIVSYGSRGVGKDRVTKSEHAIIFTGAQAPRAMDHERPARDEDGMRSKPIRVIPDDPIEKLDPVSRLNFAQVHTIQHNIKVKPFGTVHPKSVEALQSQFSNVWSHKSESAVATSSKTQPEAPVASSSHPQAHGNARLAPRQTDQTARRPSQTVPSQTHKKITAELKGKMKVESSEEESSSDDEKQIPKNDVEQSRIEAQRSQALQAQNLKQSMHGLMQQGQTRESAFEIIVQRFVQRGYHRDAAVALVRARLAYGQGGAAPAARQTDDDDSDDGSESSDAASSSEDEKKPGKKPGPPSAKPSGK